MTDCFDANPPPTPSRSQLLRGAGAACAVGGHHGSGCGGQAPACSMGCTGAFSWHRRRAPPPLQDGRLTAPKGRCPAAWTRAILNRTCFVTCFGTTCIKHVHSGVEPPPVPAHLRAYMRGDNNTHISLLIVGYTPQAHLEYLAALAQRLQACIPQHLVELLRHLVDVGHRYTEHPRVAAGGDMRLDKKVCKAALGPCLELKRAIFRNFLSVRTSPPAVTRGCCAFRYPTSTRQRSGSTSSSRTLACGR